MKFPWLTRRKLEIVTPLLLLIVLAALFVLPVRAYFECRYSKCQPIAGNLIMDPTSNVTGVLVVDHQPREGPPGETPENRIKREDEVRIQSHERAARTYSGRINFLFFTMVYLSLCAVAVVVACYVISRSCAPKSLLCVLIGIVITGLVSIYLYNNFENHMRIFSPLMKATVLNDLTVAWQLQRVSNSFGFAIVLLLTLASCAALYPQNSNSLEDGLKQISVQMRRLRLILYVGTFMLVVGVLQVRSLYQWSEAYLVRDDRLIKAAETFFSGLLSLEGGYFTLVLAVVYLPAAYILRMRADSVDKLPELETDKETILQEYNVAFSLTQSLPRVVAILGPLLIGPVGELFSRVI